MRRYQDTVFPLDYVAAGLPEPPNMGGPDGEGHKNVTDCVGNNDLAAMAFIKQYVGLHWEFGVKNRGPSASGDYLFSYCDDLAQWSRFS